MTDYEPQLAVKKERIRPINGPGIFWLLIILVLFLLALSVLMLGKQNVDNSGMTIVSETPTPTPSESTPAKMYTVTYKNGVFSPTNLRIHAGDTVRFKNDGAFPIRIVSSDIVGFDSVGDIPQGSYFSFTFAAKGTFSYYNTRSTEQTGSIIVR